MYPVVYRPNIGNVESIRAPISCILLYITLEMWNHVYPVVYNIGNVESIRAPITCILLYITLEMRNP